MTKIWRGERRGALLGAAVLTACVAVPGPTEAAAAPDGPGPEPRAGVSFSPCRSETPDLPSDRPEGCGPRIGVVVCLPHLHFVPPLLGITCPEPEPSTAPTATPGPAPSQTPGPSPTAPTPPRPSPPSPTPSQSPTETPSETPSAPPSETPPTPKPESPAPEPPTSTPRPPTASPSVPAPPTVRPRTPPVVRPSVPARPRPLPVTTPPVVAPPPAATPSGSPFALRGQRMPGRFAERRRGTDRRLVVLVLFTGVISVVAIATLSRGSRR